MSLFINQCQYANSSKIPIVKKNQKKKKNVELKQHYNIMKHVKWCMQPKYASNMSKSAMWKVNNKMGTKSPMPNQPLKNRQTNKQQQQQQQTSPESMKYQYG